MKISRWVITLAIIFPFNLLFGQINDNDFLKSYKAPEYKYQSLILDFKSNGKGEFSSTNSINGGAKINYYNYRNTVKTQGYNGFSIGSSYKNSKNEFFNSSDLNFVSTHNMKMLMFFGDRNWFGGVSNFASVGQYNTFIKDSTKSDGLNLRVNPTLSFGIGRLEPIYYARKSKDIEKALLKSNTISSELSLEQKTILADHIAKLQNRRFFDTRLNRIYQLESLDSILQDMGVVDETSMTYFSHLTDAFSFSHNANRYSGKQFEIGVSQSFLAIERSNYPESNQQVYGLNGFVSYAYHLPASYSIQHNFKTSLIIGKQRTFWNDYLIDDDVASLFFEYNFGYYPTTRTYLDVKAYVGAVWDNTTAGVRGQLYYYLSPKVRVNALLELRLKETNSTTSIYNNIYLNQLIDQNSLIGSNNYSFSLGINYAIF